MAKEILKDVRVEIASTVLGNKARSVTIDGDADLQPTTGFGDTNQTYVVGYKNWTVTLDIYDDYDDNQINELLFGWWGTEQAIKIRKASGSIGAGNPEYQGNVIFQRVPLMNAQNGQVSTKSVTLQGSGTLTRAVA